ncbi:hypothetical protein B0H14DRAFT_2642008 [Mycena olivaceomarginata]|nr:hypothetical protein B0H14DRAFT_2642008 [Mycena olivaceomarginata]
MKWEYELRRSACRPIGRRASYSVPYRSSQPNTSPSHQDHPHHCPPQWSQRRPHADERAERVKCGEGRGAGITGGVLGYAASGAATVVGLTHGEGEGARVGRGDGVISRRKTEIRKEEEKGGETHSDDVLGAEEVRAAPGAQGRYGEFEGQVSDTSRERVGNAPNATIPLRLFLRLLGLGDLRLDRENCLRTAWNGKFE